MRQLKITQQITSRETKSLERYLQEVSKIPMITPEEEVELAKKIKIGDKVALERLVNANLRFVVSVAKQYQHTGMKLEDLINEGNIGLIKAAQRFDETKGFKFISYAVWWIRQAILEASTSSARLVRLPANRIGSIKKIADAYMELEQKYERPPSDEEVAKWLKTDPEQVKEALMISKKHVSMDAPIGGDEENSTMVNTMEDEDSEQPTDDLMDESLSKEIDEALSTVLNETENKALRLYFGLGRQYPMSLDDISKQFGVTPERVRMIKDKAIKKLRSSASSGVLKAYL